MVEDLVDGLIQHGGGEAVEVGGDGATREFVSGPVRTDAGQRSIPIPASLSGELAANLARRAPVGRLEPLIVNKQGRAVNRDTFRAKVVRAAGLPEDFRTYDLRHNHASLLIDSGANVLAVAQRMGHTDPAITLRVYGHLFEGVQEELTESLDRRRRADGVRAAREVVPIRRLDAHDGAGWFGAPEQGTGTPVCVRYERITTDPERMGGVPCIRDLRFPVATVVGMVADGMTTQQILAEHPELEEPDIREALRYAAEAVSERELPLRSGA
jgi:uncharacterized protein (DUF433 family)